MRNLTILIILFCSFYSFGKLHSQTWQADTELVEKLSESRDFNYHESKVPDYTLPDLFTSIDGIQVETSTQWEAFRRDEILSLLQMQLFGKMIGQPDRVIFELIEKKDTLKGRAFKKTVDITFIRETESLVLKLWIFVPKNIPKPAPVYLLANNRGDAGLFPIEQVKAGFWPVEKILKRGYIAACYNVKDIDPDSNDNLGFDNGIHGMIEPAGQRPEYAWGTLAGWAYGARTVMDYFETDSDIDSEKVGLVGHSRGGKTALWAGATDKRFSIIVSNMSGCGGAALSRREYGETVKQINTRFPHWFAKNFHAYNGKEEDLPFDQHMLLAMIAPRGLYVSSADKDLWADPKGEFLSLKQAEKVYHLYGINGIQREIIPPLDTPVMGEQTGYHVRTGKHNLTPYDWEQFLNFADQVFEK